MSDINGGQFPNPNGSPIWPGTLLTGPILAGNVLHSDGSGALAGVGEYSGQANVGYAQMCQTAVISQANGATTIVVPAQSQITDIYLMVTTAWSGGSTAMSVGSTVSNTAFTAAGALAGGTLGQNVAGTPGTGAVQIANWDNVGATDAQVKVTSINSGAGVGTLTVFYIQGINNAS